MKQREDNLTLELDLYVQSETSAAKPLYRFYIETPDGQEVEWRGLTKKQARDMYAYTDAHQPCNVVRCGWEQTR